MIAPSCYMMLSIGLVMSGISCASSSSCCVMRIMPFPWVLLSTVEMLGLLFAFTSGYGSFDLAKKVNACLKMQTWLAPC